jgi:hypothetical protein
MTNSTPVATLRYGIKIQNIKSKKCFGHWNFEFRIYLEFGAWDLGFNYK